MAAISLSIPHGKAGMTMSDFTVGTLAPNAGDMEVRLNTTDTNSKNISHLEMVIAVRMFLRVLENGGPSLINLTPLSGGAAPPPLV